MARKTTKEIKAEDLQALPENYSIRFQMAKLREIEENVNRLKLDNVKKDLDLTKARGNLCYIKVAGDCFNSALAQIADVLKSAPSRITNEMRLSPSQAEELNTFFDDLLSDLAAIEIDIPTTTETDASLEKASKAAREQARGG